MFVIKKITQHYDPEQDRISLTAQTAEEQVIVLWLTQRLVNRLAEILSSWLEKEVKAMVGEHSIFSLQAWEQSAAQAQLKPEPPVVRTAAQSEALVNLIDLGHSSKGYTLTFKWKSESEGSARLMLTATEMRQWLIILYKQFDVAGWTKLAWPKWFSVDTQSGTPSSTHHCLH